LVLLTVGFDGFDRDVLLSWLLIGVDVAAVSVVLVQGNGLRNSYPRLAVMLIVLVRIKLHVQMLEVLLLSLFG